ncbi:hypothetical protein [uncultured Clostridium sp.]|jgi:hypothetical protein|uniref:hypothetical protein n=1 Tax=uncultured Clostridium sp. TaxID=59620 RepID=UPI002615A61E|nr:hypothetical protein [uncultured Clostridium sp.]
MKRKIEMLEVKLVAKNKTDHDDDFEVREFSEFVIIKDIFDYHYNKELSNKREFKGRHIAFLIELIKNIETDSEENKIANSQFIKMNYIKYNKATQVVDTDFVRAFKKAKNQGDLDNQHYIHTNLRDCNIAIIAWENIMGAVSKSMLEYEFNRSYKAFIKENYKLEGELELRDRLLNFELKINHLPCTKFLDELQSLNKISLFKFNIGKNFINLDEDVKFGNETIFKDSVELIYKPIIYNKCFKKEVTKYIKNMNKDKVTKIVISGTKDGSPISIDTEKIKYNKYIEVKEDIDGLVDSEDIQNILIELLAEVIENYNPDICIALDEAEE